MKTAPRVTVDPDDLALNDDLVAQFVWYHTSTHPDWPRRNFDPAAGLTDKTRCAMGGDAAVAHWVERQLSKALHVGSYESAIHNMLRRVANQSDRGQQFHLYRVRLKSTIVVREGWVIDPSDWLGDVILDDVCPADIDVARYLNYHEDPGGLSVALGPAAIASVQQMAIPQPGPDHREWVAQAVLTVANAVETSLLPSESSRLARFRHPPSPQKTKAGEIASELAERLPINLRSQFQVAAAFFDGMDPETWARYVIGLVDLIENPEMVLIVLDTQEIRLL